jgi:hypothetical protein
MRIEREMTVINIPSWYRIALRGSVFGILIGTIVAVSAAGWWGLFVLILTPLLAFFRYVSFESRTITVRIDESFSIIGSDRIIEIPFDELQVREHHGSYVSLEVAFPYRDGIWRGVIARKDAPNIVVPSADDPALYARIRATLRSS